MAHRKTPLQPSACPHAITCTARVQSGRDTMPTAEYMLPFLQKIGTRGCITQTARQTQLLSSAAIASSTGFAVRRWSRCDKEAASQAGSPHQSPCLLHRAITNPVSFLRVSVQSTAESLAGAHHRPSPDLSCLILAGPPAAVSCHNYS